MIVPMKKLLLAGRVGDRQRVLGVLREVGTVHVEPVYPELAQASGELLKEIAETAKALEALDKFQRPSSPPTFEGSAQELSHRVASHLRHLSSLEAERAEVVQEMERVAPWGPLDAEALQELRQAGLHVAFYLCPQDQEDSVEADLLHRAAVRDGTSYLVAVSKRALQAGEKAVPVPQPPRDIVELKKELKRITEGIRQTQASLGELAALRGKVAAYHRELLNLKTFFEVENSLMKDGPIFVLKGWVPVHAVMAVQEHMQRAGLTVGMQFEDPREEELPPTKLENPWWCRPIECLYKLLGITPGYREVDISPLFLPFLTVFTAMLFADAGYGLVALAGLLLISKFLGKNGPTRQLLQLFLVLFSGVLVYGILTDSYFGEKLITLTGFDALSPEGEYFLKKLCFTLGALHITLAHAWKIRRHPWNPSILSELGWLMFIWPMYALVNVLVLGVPQPPWMVPTFALSLGLIVLFTAPSRNPLKAVGKGLGAVALNAAAFLSDIISYIRLWAVGLAGGVLAASFNELAAPLPLLLAVVILIAAHFLNMALSLVAVFAHGVRLNLLEFSNHAGVEWGGWEYDPFANK